MKQPPSAAFLSPFGGTAPSAAVKKKHWGTWGAPTGFKYLRRATRIPNVCLVLKLDYGKVISIADDQKDGQTDKATQYGISI